MFLQVSVNKGGYPSLWSQAPSQPLVTCSFQGGEYPSPGQGATPVPAGGTPWDRTGLGYPCQPAQDLGIPPQPGLVMPRAVCLLQFPAGLSCYEAAHRVTNEDQYRYRS